MKTAALISFAGSQLAETRNVCVFFDSEEEEYRVLLPFIKDGFECGYKSGRMRTHPILIIGGILQQNPFFVPPSEFLREFSERRTGRSTATSAGR